MALWLAGVHRQIEESGGTFTGGPNKGVLHSTEGANWPNYGYAPHLTGKPLISEKRIEWRQHIPLDVAARAMENRSGGIQTNRDSARQIELVGTTDPKHTKSWGGRGTLVAGRDYIYYPEAPDWVLVEIAKMMSRVSAECGIPKTLVRDWLPYPKSYGNTAVRMSLQEWDDFAGWCAHQHVPENSHGDVLLDAKRLQELLGGSTPPVLTRPGRLLSEDGRMDEGTTKIVQKWLRVPADGDWGPQTTKGLQRWVRVEDDGILGPITIKALQKKLGVAQTGSWNLRGTGDPTTLAFERYLNRGIAAGSFRP